MKRYNPPAFPHLEAHDPSFAYVATGMTLRDWFAGQALPSIIAACAGDTNARRAPSLEEYFAERAYTVADALLAEREKRND